MRGATSPMESGVRFGVQLCGTLDLRKPARVPLTEAKKVPALNGQINETLDGLIFMHR